MNHLDDFFEFATERENIRVRRETGQEPPWTPDPILANNFFCNVFREDDKVTRWFREEVRDPVAEDPMKAVLACAVFRWFNFIPTGEVLRPFLLEGIAHGPALRDRLKELDQVVGGAYLIKSPAGMDKVDGLLECIVPVERAAGNLGWAATKLNYSLEYLHGEIMNFPYLGRFMAYEIVTDLRHTIVGRDAEDIMTWASAGPGCARGLGWVVADDPSEFSYGSTRQQRAMLVLMRELLVASQDTRYWPFQRQWEMREVEHVLCEFAKYRAAQTGRRIKRKFNAHDRRSQRSPGDS